MCSKLSALTDFAEDERKVLFSMLGKLHLAFTGQIPEMLRTVLELVAEAQDTKLASDATSRNTLVKLQNTLLKLVHDSATAERGGEETVFDETMMTATPGRRRRTRNVREEEEEEVEDEPTMQLRREVETTQIKDEDVEMSMADTTVGAQSGLEGYDLSQLPTEAEMSLIDDCPDEDDD